ncbi:helix-turn-helix domain-containing protein [Cellulosimicrobium cellulans]|uniref:helix-turn-helix domain-containing protein n=1 Tax=Cellulosimicrobium cellulans TaxID=1710 RepID=UPI002406C3CE|nr:helix-turn-helix transcriptional regulator [Cellulosimicrobium cellulans]MDF9877480.1 transcriptional regulator with XRE-family HTH domain [Cellulosimicrobium cellulans]
MTRKRETRYGTDVDERDVMIGRRIAQLRSAQGLSQAELASSLRDSGVRWSQGTLSKVEAGQRPVRLAEAEAVARELDADIAELLAPHDFIAQLRMSADQGEIEARSRYIRAVRAAWHANIRARVIRLLEEIRDGGRGPYRVHGVDAVGLVQFVTEGIVTGAYRELQAILESFGLGDEAAQLMVDARRQVRDWMDDPRTVPPHFTPEEQHPTYLDEWLSYYPDAVDGDEDSIEGLVGEIFESGAIRLLEKRLSTSVDFVDFDKVDRDMPYRVEGVAGPPEMKPPQDVLSDVEPLFTPEFVEQMNRLHGEIPEVQKRRLREAGLDAP